MKIEAKVLQGLQGKELCRSGPEAGCLPVEDLGWCNDAAMRGLGRFRPIFMNSPG